MRSLLLLLVVACSSPMPPTADLPDAATDGAPAIVDAPDAATCTASEPSAVGVDVTSVKPQPLVLDGVGWRCDQIVRAILDPAQRPAELAALDATSGVDSPLCTEFGARTAVRFDVNAIMGRRLLSGGQWFLAWVDHDTNKLEELTGWYVQPPTSAPSACATDDELTAALIGHEQPYSTFQWCAPTGSAVWTLGEKDSKLFGDEGWYFDGTRLLAAREIDISVAPDAITQQLRDSDLNCCGVIDAVGCIGLRLIVDASSGKVLGERRHCIVC